VQNECLVNKKEKAEQEVLRINIKNPHLQFPQILENKQFDQKEKKVKRWKK